MTMKQSQQVYVDYFNSHPHEEDDLFLIYVWIVWVISTHILTKRMTTVVWLTRHCHSFQLTSSRRGWQLIPVTLKNIQFISTHILTKRMTTGSTTTISAGSISTHILTKRMTGERVMKHNENIFQLTSSRRGWRVIQFTLTHIHISTHILTKRMTANSADIASLKTFQLTSSRRGWLPFSCI